MRITAIDHRIRYTYTIYIIFGLPNIVSTMLQYIPNILFDRWHINEFHLHALTLPLFFFSLRNIFWTIIIFYFNIIFMNNEINCWVILWDEFQIKIIIMNKQLSIVCAWLCHETNRKYNCNNPKKTKKTSNMIITWLKVDHLKSCGNFWQILIMTKTAIER